MSNEGLGQVVSWYICTIFPIIFLVARLVVRWKRFGGVSIEDGLLVLAACCLVGDLAIQQYMWNLGMANLADVGENAFISIMKMIIPGSVLYVTSLWLIKFALVLFYKRLAVPGSGLQLAYNITLGILVVTWLVIFFDIIFQCFPNDKRWSSDPSYQCSSKASDINYWITILLNILSDVFIICLPITMVLKLQMKTKQKLGVLAMFCLGAFTVIASIVRAYYSKLNETMLTCTVSMVETGIALTTSCLPPLRAILLGHTSQTGTSQNYNHYELSSHNKKTARSRTTTSVVGGALPITESEDDLLKEGGTSVSGSTSQSKEIFVKTTISMHHSSNNNAQ